MNEPRKLKRGLKDISPLFAQDTAKETPPAELHAPVSIQCISVFSPDAPGDSLFLNSFIAAKLAQPERVCSIISIQPHSEMAVSSSRRIFQASASDSLKRFSLTWSQFERVCCSPVPPPEPSLFSQKILLLDFDPAKVPFFEKVIPILDKWILVLEPKMESLAENFKLIKAAAGLNTRMEFFILYNGACDDTRAAFVFERFSNLTAKHLSVQLNWLGSMHLPKGFPPAAELSLDYLFLKAAPKNDSLEKRALAGLMDSAS